MNLRHTCLLVSSFAFATATRGDDPHQVPLRAADGTLIALSQPAASPNKPYIAQLFAPGGEKSLALLDDSPPDHFHHHGLMFAIGVDDTDFWTEKGAKNAGREEPVKTDTTKSGDGFSQQLKCLATDGTHLLDEARQVRVRVTGAGSDAVHWLDWQTVISPAPGRESVKLWGHHYFGLGMRFQPAWNNKATFVWSDTAGQKVVRGDEKLTPGPWGAARCEIEGRPVTLLMIDHPANSRPARWFTMDQPFCYLSAALGLDTDPATLVKDQRWTLRYGIAVVSGPADNARLAKLAEEWRKSATTESQPPPAKP